MAEVVLKGPLYLCQQCHSLIRANINDYDIRVKRHREIPDRLIRATEIGFICPVCQRFAVAMSCTDPDDILRESELDELSGRAEYLRYDSNHDQYIFFG